MFEMEQQIMDIWSMKEDLELIMENVMDGNLTADQMNNSLLGLSEMHDMKCRKLFNHLEALMGEV
jgi:hypothetical protein